MPLPSWLRPLLGRHRATPATQTQPQNDAPPAPIEVDNGVRMHLAASDPEFPAKREAAVESIIAAIDTIAAAHGFSKKAKSWAKTGPLGLVSIHLQRSHYGFEAYINLGFQPVSEQPLGLWAHDETVRLDRFYPDSADAPPPDGALIYLDVYDEPDSLSPAMTILDDRALPWLVAHLTDPAAHTKPLLPDVTVAEHPK